MALGTTKNCIWAGILALAIACSASLAGPTPAPVHAEIEALLTKLQASGCQFNRNGSWYDGAKAKAHLLRKLEAIERRGTLESAEQFIALAASGSSISGRPYLVRCAGAAPVESRQWLMGQLVSLRGGAAKGKP